jgi:hypothetical protein
MNFIRDSQKRVPAPAIRPAEASDESPGKIRSHASLAEAASIRAREIWFSHYQTM